MENKNIKIETIPILDKNIGLNYSEAMTSEEKVNYLAQNLRLTINNLRNLKKWTKSHSFDTKWTPFKKNEYDIEHDELRGEGRALTEFLIRLHGDKKGIEFTRIDISSLAELYSDEHTDLKIKLKRNKHSLAIAIIDGKKYIIDCAYRQFFQSGNNSIKEPETLNLVNAVNKDEKTRALAEQILKYGWIEATPENLKRYLDSFIEASAKDEKIKLATEEEYTENIKGEYVSNSEKTLNKFYIRIICQLYDKKSKLEISDELQDFIIDHRDILREIKNNLSQSESTFSIILKDGKKYIRTETQDIEYTEENFKNYLDSILIEAADGENVTTPTIQEYFRIYSCKDPTKRPYKYIIESEPYICDENNQSDDFNIEMTDKEKLTSIVQKERRRLMKCNNLENDSLMGECEDSTMRVLFDCVSKGCKEISFLFPSRYLKNGIIGHNCSIVQLNGKSYLIDCTYRQFFEDKYSGLCGIYMINNPRRKEVAEQILKYGWIEATPENIKAYMDGFEMASRRSFEETRVSAEEYIKRLRENKANPIHIVTPREMLESGLEENINLDDMEKIGMLISSLEQKKKDTSP